MLPPAVEVRNACKAYGECQILNNFNMTVHQGSIYGLLGASGCGKTTILSCMVGLKNVDKGDVLIYGNRPVPGKTIGYMPQDVALYNKLTIKEILLYYGRIYDMTDGEINSRIEFLMSFLDLPDSSQLIKTLSGGEQRRTSLGVAMIHQPKLLILDEPTVGVDALIREKIWWYLNEMVSKTQTTVIITTHYIEEARQSNTVAVMRNGRLLVEKCPKVLLKEYGTNLLEGIVLQLCKEDNEGLLLEYNNGDGSRNELVENSIGNMYKNNLQNDHSLFKLQDDEKLPVIGINYKCVYSEDDGWRTQQQPISNVSHSNVSLSSQLNKIQTLIYRNFLNLFRHQLFLFLTLVIPTFQLSLLNFIMGNDPTYTAVAVVNNEFNSTNFLDICKQRPSSGCLNDGLSCAFINQFSDFEIDWKPYLSEEEAVKSVLNGHSLGAISIPFNFTEKMKYRALEGQFLTNETLEGSTISVRLDLSYALKSSFLSKEFYSKYLDFIKEVTVECGGDPRTVEVPLKFNAIYGSLQLDILAFVQPAHILLIIFVLPLAVSMLLIDEKNTGCWDRTMSTGVDYFQVAVSYVFSEGCLIILELALGFTVLRFGFNLTINGSVVLCFLLAFMTGICGVSFGFLIGTICNKPVEALICGLTVFLPSLFTCGIIWPIEGTPMWARYIIRCLPITLGVESIRSITGRGWGIFHCHVYPGFVVIFAWTLFCFVASGSVHRMRK